MIEEKRPKRVCSGKQRTTRIEYHNKKASEMSENLKKFTKKRLNKSMEEDKKIEINKKNKTC